MGEVAPAALGGVDDEMVSLVNQEIPLLSPQDVLGHNHIGVKVVWGAIQLTFCTLGAKLGSKLGRVLVQIQYLRHSKFRHV